MAAISNGECPHFEVPYTPRFCFPTNNQLADSNECEKPSFYGDLAATSKALFWCRHKKKLKKSQEKTQTAHSFAIMGSPEKLRNRRGPLSVSPGFILYLKKEPWASLCAN